MLKKINLALVVACVVGLCVFAYIQGYAFGYVTGQSDAHSYTVGRLRTTCERQYVMRDLGFYTGNIDNVRGDLTIAAEKRYFRWYGHCAAAGKRVDPNIIHWEDNLKKEGDYE